MEAEIVWPVKQRELVMFVIDSRKWNDFAMRDDDIVIGTWAKSGTTWMQQIVGQLIFGGAPDVDRHASSPWIDTQLDPDAVARANAQTHRRFLKTHLPIDAIIYSPKAKYIYIGRDGRDVYWSWHNHHAGFSDDALKLISSFNPERPPYVHPNPDVRLAFHDWLDRDGYPNWPFWSHVQGWFDARSLPNLKLLHFANLKADLRGEIEKLASFLGIEVVPSQWADILEHCGIDYMRAAEAARMQEKGPFTNGAATFFNKGTNGRWKDVLTAEDNARYYDEVRKHLTPDCAHWLETGALPE